MFSWVVLRLTSLMRTIRGGQFFVTIAVYDGAFSAGSLGPGQTGAEELRVRERCKSALFGLQVERANQLQLELCPLGKIQLLPQTRGDQEACGGSGGRADGCSLATTVLRARRRSDRRARRRRFRFTATFAGARFDLSFLGVALFHAVFAGDACDLRDNRQCARGRMDFVEGDRKSTRLNSSHLVISYAVFCLKKKKKKLSFSNRVVSDLAFFLKKTKATFTAL